MRMARSRYGGIQVAQPGVGRLQHVTVGVDDSSGGRGRHGAPILPPGPDGVKALRDGGWRVPPGGWYRPGVVKAVSFFKRKAGMAVDDFQTYWRRRHPDAVLRLPGIRRYVQSHTRPAAYARGEPIYDGIAELWFEDTRAMHALRGTPAMAAVEADEAAFIDRATMRLLLTEEHVIKDGPAAPGAAKNVEFVNRKPSMAVEDFQRYWREIHGPLRRDDPGDPPVRAEPRAPLRLRAGAGAGLRRCGHHLVRRHRGDARLRGDRRVPARPGRRAELHRAPAARRSSSPPST